MKCLTKPLSVVATAALCLAGGAALAEDAKPGVETPKTAAPAAPKPAKVAGIGEWTTDWPAALKVAKERKLPLLVQFTGSDWCGWCKWMEANALSKPEFLEAMKTECVLVVVDFPQKIQQADALKAQNKQLADKYKKSGGFPVYKIVDSDGETITWSFGAHPKYCDPKRGDVKLLIADVKAFCAGCNGSIERGMTGLGPEKAVAYQAAAKELQAVQKEAAAWLDTKPSGKESKAKYEGYLAKMRELSDKMKVLQH